MKKPVNLINFFDRVPTEYRQDAMFRAYGRHRQRCHLLQIENKRRHQSVSEPQLSLSECRESEIPIDGDVVINFGSRWDSK